MTESLKHSDSVDSEDIYAQEESQELEQSRGEWCAWFWVRSTPFSTHWSC